MSGWIYAYDSQAAGWEGHNLEGVRLAASVDKLSQCS